MRAKNKLFWGVALLGLILDRVTKLWVISSFELTRPPESWPLWPGVFHLTYVTNSGAAFSLFTNGSGWLRWLSLGVSLVLGAVAIWGPRFCRWEQWGYGLLLAGALGNGIDRFLTGEVVDFLDFRLISFPIFNVADICINAGLVCLIIHGWRSHKAQS